MSLIKAIKAQLGLSGTATQNFTLTAEAADGTMKLARGNAGATTQDILTVDASGVVSMPQTPNTQIGVGQTWQAVTRTTGTTYTNNTGKPIMLAVNATTSTNNVSGYFQVAISGVNLRVAQGGGGAVAQCIVSGAIIIPDGADYTVTISNLTSVSVAELR